MDQLDQPGGDIDDESVALWAAADQQGAAIRDIDIDDNLERLFASPEAQQAMERYRAAVEALRQPPGRLARLGAAATDYARREPMAILKYVGFFVAGSLTTAYIKNRFPKA